MVTSAGSNRMSADKHVRTSERKVRFGQHTCFLCSTPLRSKNRTDEHVFPKWLQNRFNLWNQRLDLINLTDIPYRNLTIPCCKTCNGVHLSRSKIRFRKLLKQARMQLLTCPRRSFICG